jgi:hypothetical protein
MQWYRAFLWRTSKARMLTAGPQRILGQIM